MGPFRWPDTRHDIALATEVATNYPVKPHDCEIIAGRLSTAFSTDLTQVELKARGCRNGWIVCLKNLKLKMLKLSRGLICVMVIILTLYLIPTMQIFYIFWSNV